MGVRQNIQKLKSTGFFKENLWEINVVDTSFSDLSLFATSVDFPPSKKFEVEEDKQTRRKYYKNYTDPDQIVITIIETEDLKATKFIDKWIDSFITLDGAFRANRNPKKTFTIRLQKFKKGILSAISNGVLNTPILESAGAIGGLNLAGLSGFGNAFGLDTSALDSSVGDLLGIDSFDTIRAYNLVDCQFLDRDNFTLNYENGTSLPIVQVTLSVDRIVPFGDTEATLSLF